MSEILSDFFWYCKSYLYIKTEYGEVVPFVMNQEQREFAKEVLAELNAGIPVRVIVLKPRQIGFSTIIQAIIFWWNHTHSNQKALTLAHAIEASINLFDMYKRFHEHLPEPIKPPLERSNERKVSFETIKSENKISSGGSGEVGRSDTFQAVHYSEAAFYQDPKTVFVALNQASKYARMIFIESTANGFNDFRDRVYDALEGRSNYRVVFISWLDFNGYINEALKLGFIKIMSKQEEDRLLNSLGDGRYNTFEDEEKILHEQYNATPLQLSWRRYAIDNLCEGDGEKFRQEYPHSIESAFLASGKPFFNVSICAKKIMECKEPLMVGDLEVVYDDSEAYKQRLQEEDVNFVDLRSFVKEVRFVENPRGYVSIWDEIKKNEGYYRFCSSFDVAEGIEQGDYTAGVVLDRESMKEVMTWHGHLDADLIAQEQFKIWWFLGKDCHFATEKNNMGVTVVNKAFDLGVPQFHRMSFDSGRTKVSKDNFGFKTSSTTKMHAANLLKEWIREDEWICVDKAFWLETLTFVRDEKGRISAEGKHRGSSNFDDRIISRAINCIAHQWLPPFIPIKEERKSARSFISNRVERRTKF